MLTYADANYLFCIKNKDIPLKFKETVTRYCISSNICSFLNGHFLIHFKHKTQSSKVKKIRHVFSAPII